MSAQQEFTERAQLGEQYNQLPVVLWGNLIIAGFTGLFYLNLVNPVLLSIWLSLLVAIVSFRYLLFRAFRKAEIKDSGVKNWLLAYAVCSAVTGSWWAVLGIYLIQTVDPASLIIICLALIGLTGGNIATASYRRRMFVCFSTPALVPVGLVALFGGNSVVVTLGAFCLALYVLTLIAVNRLSKSLMAALRLDFENRELIKELEAEKSRLEISNQRLNQELQRKLSMTKWLASGTDQLTSSFKTDVSNGNFNRVLADMWEHAIEYQQPLSLVIFELDGNHHWPENDGFLNGQYEKIQGEICSAIRTNDVFIRINNKELAIILAQMVARDAVILINRLRGKLVSIGHLENNQPGGKVITMSWGIAGWIPDVTQDASELIAASRHAKNQSKSRGGNQVSLC